MEVINEWVKSGLLFGVIGSVIIMLSPNKTYEKYISFVVGLLFVFVMIHPLMILFSVDSETFLRSVENYLIFQDCSGGLSQNDRCLYEDALGMQIKAVLIDSGCEIQDVVVKMDETGTVYEVDIIVCGKMIALSQIENYLRSLFGEEVVVSYETK
ncbi:MAG: stage III sporulation protein AF [Lachnospiraceae bacterium]